MIDDVVMDGCYKCIENFKVKIWRKLVRSNGGFCVCLFVELGFHGMNKFGHFQYELELENGVD